MDWLLKVVDLGGLGSGWKTIIGTLLLLLPKYITGFPVLELSHGVTAAQILLALAALKKFLEKFKKA